TDHGHEGRAAGDDARLAVEPGDGVERFAQGLGLEETEGMQSHRYLEPAAAASTASTIFVYPVQRHRLPDSASRTSSIVGAGCSASSAFAESSMPGVQNPHCAAPRSANSTWSGSSRPSTSSPSMVTISR